MARTSGRSEQEIERLLKGFKPSGMTRREYCQAQGIAVTTFDYYRRTRQTKKKEHRPRSTPVVRVELTNPALVSETVPQHPGGFTLVLANSRRIESGWLYGEQELAKLIRVVEAA